MKQDNLNPELFYPAFGLRNTHTQSVLNSGVYRRRIVSNRSRSMLEAGQKWIVDGGDGVRLLGYYSAQPAQSRGLVILFHGWEGSSSSNYVISVGGALFDQGFDIFRLNFRDHGGTHDMNPGIFHSCRLDEVVHAVKEIEQRTGSAGWMLAGYSLGGNFALRVGLRAPSAGLALRRVVAVSPVISPANTLVAMESGPGGKYEEYYVKKWARSMRLKQARFPDAYDYGTWYGLAGLRQKTDFMATRYYEFDTLEDYFEGYSVAGDRLAAMQVPTTILTSEDDMVIPVSDFRNLPDNENIELLITRYGGHCAFLQNWKMDCWADDLIAARMLDCSI
ncbi:MAG: alpha/beta fold hydrolase [Xanthomonadales bacterium]|nr:alpha/beta fold hydrolase [Xanthomonadales bacterium]